MASLEDLKGFARRSGRSDDAGPGKCFWADEFALRAISDWLRLTILIIDDQATRGIGCSSKRKSDGRTVEPTSSSSNGDNRFVCIGNYERAVILHRSRMQHYNAVIIDDRPVVDDIELLPSHVRSLWVMVGKSEEAKPESTEKPGDELKDDFTSRLKCVSDECDPVLNSKSPPNNDLDESATISSLQTLGNFYCGCAGFSSPSWVGNFYPRNIVGHNSDRQLDHYQQHFRTVEINSTFYGIPSDSTVRKWKDAFAKSFRVVVKAPRGLTHECPSLDFSVLSTFLTRMEGLEDSLACILIQCPKTLTVTTSHLLQMKMMMETEARWYRGRIAFEFRNEATYYDNEVRKFFRLNNYSLVMHPNSLGRSTVGTSLNGRGITDLVEYQPEELSSVAAAGGMHSNFVYLRLHGSNDEHRGEYSVSQLEEISKQIHSWREQCLDVFCFFLNDQDPTVAGHASKKSTSQPWDVWCAMPKNAKQLENIVYKLSKENTPDGPKKPKSTLLNFFRKR
ncbi:hypothetical protein ACHAW5_009009 [Stephanodiscus triporus]|uniref:DUF72 domain-containing protein n=1 Tax=Stephanodiscus triporus TaxID=2934178 RepID=A0ABD3P4V6_9STRA